MFKKKVLSIISVALILCILFAGCNGSDNNDAEKVAYTVKVETIGGMPLEDIMIKVYKDAEMQNLQWGTETDNDGVITFNAEPSKTYYAVLEEVQEGYKLEANYEITSENTTISLETVIGDAKDMSGVTYKLGNVVHDFTVTAIDGKEYKISDLLKTKKAIVLNFWYLNCQPCKMEFPYLQQAYIDYQDEIALIAINPYDGTNDTVSAYAVENKLTFPMVSDEKIDWASIVQLTAYPTTVVIDRYGTICMMHRGMVTSKEDFTKVFEFFTADDYKQTLIRNLNDIE